MELHGAAEQAYGDLPPGPVVPAPQNASPHRLENSRRREAYKMSN
jgi:hypothetical protein